ncbi:Cu2+-exporting ATPase [Actinoalloteichus hoggarensis]|uniref:Copper-exporting P-type ATPase B n=1 Tax=Actinoalloteichus hoggarensis TaxID=1470176 RepID=A0A221VZ43_9PSEU|nr:heavy metal translocating P-type ATPase [Actinoalloteichus hoggarensis]ASO18786.1 Copper-exporting P-type ATPase B [Actinoalloteichus hoggarensis]MBB5920018.1 Cu2+-exporting ATPase [Actinoalloteichus hoggarensis]
MTEHHADRRAARPEASERRNVETSGGPEAAPPVGEDGDSVSRQADHDHAAADRRDHRDHDARSDRGDHPDRGHGDHGDHAVIFRDRFWLSLVLSVPVVFASHLVADLLGYEVTPGASWMPPVLGTFVFLYGGSPFLTGAVSELRRRQPGMMTLVALAITVAFAASALTTLGIGGLDLDFWWELVLLIVIMLLGHWLEMRALGQATGALGALAELLPDTAERIDDDGTTRPVPLARLGVGDLVLVRSGGRVPADGVVSDGTAAVDESMITGESAAVRRTTGDRVVAGTVATDSALRVRISAVGADTALAGIARLVEQAQSSRSRAQALADRAAAALFWFALVAGVVTFVVWSSIGEPTTAVERTVTVLIIACPHALGLAIPLVIAISTSMSAKAGILIKDRLALERMRTVDTVLFDKTGTLTKGRPAVTDVVPVAGFSRPAVLAAAAAAESDSEHPLARAVVAAARRSGEVPAAQDFRSLTGRGVRAVVDGATIAVGGPALLREHGVEPPAESAAAVDDAARRGAGVLYVLRDDAVIGVVTVADEIRSESREAVAALHTEGIRVVLITGDARGVAESVAGELGVDEVFAEVLPADKDGAVARLQDRGRRVAMVGDGVNDAPALARADVGIAIGAGTDVAVESAGVVLASDDPRAVLAVRRLSLASYRKMWQNLGWATAYNLVTVPLAAGVLAGIGFVLPPALGAVAMSLSTIVVALNAQLLRRVRLTEARR